ncbi:hypothetical protein BAE44_0002318 [Dichanthelium oligosanthes]|uniref:Uncharacterized protein n=1 Tax=Dichanthelium oligosanthes TaxID=888268 RepID=A0A1E5WH03_9POAL|nr:hypothetical protein BAE44_0002318 [Dichanthelium oligosanthes]
MDSLLQAEERDTVALARGPLTVAHRTQPSGESSVRRLSGAAAARVFTMAEDSGAILRHISSLKDMLDKVNEEIEQNIQRTRKIESEIVRHSETEKHYLDKESFLMKEVSVAEFELNGLIQVAAAETGLLKVTEGNLEFQKVALNGIQKRLSDKMERFINKSQGFPANTLRGSNEDLVLLLKEKSSLEGESENLKMKINTIHSSSNEYIAEILEEVNTENSGK